MKTQIRRALISVFDKTGVADFAAALAKMGVRDNLFRRDCQDHRGRRRQGQICPGMDRLSRNAGTSRRYPASESPRRDTRPAGQPRTPGPT